jgi:hypothetical protein
MSALHAVDDEPKIWAPKRLDIAAGRNKRDGYVGIDLEPDSDIVWDLFRFPWPIKTGSVQEISVSHFAEHIPHYRPEWGVRDGWFLFWEEVHRIAKKGALIHVVHPYVMSARAFWDPTHVRFIHEMSWYYLDKPWRELNGLGHYTEADFEVVVISGTGIADDISTRTPEHQAYARAHYWNVIPDLAVELKRR